MLHLVLTFDYELFFGKNYKPCDDVLFKPTAKIAQILYNHHVPGTFFADTCSVFAHERVGDLDYVKNFKEQLVTLNQMGHDVQLHIHPHWQRSTKENGEWVFPKDWYRIHDFDIKGGEAGDIIRDGITFLKETLLPADKNYKCIAYRAGGYCIQPYDDLVKVLYDEGIRIDSSVCMFMDNTVPSRFYDYKELPSSINWWLQPNIKIQNCVAEKPDGRALLEIPIGFYQQNICDRIKLGKKITYKHGKPLGEGMPTVGSENRIKQNFIQKIMTYSDVYQRLSLDTMSSNIAYLSVKRMYKMHKQENRDIYVAIVSHPKVYTGAAFDNLNDFVSKIINSDLEVKFASLRDVYDATCKWGDRNVK